jgi:hypothetical protein
MMARFRLIAVLSAALWLALPSPAPAALGATCQAKVHKLQRQNLALRRKLSTVIIQRNKAREERDTARAELSTAQNGVAGAILTMTPEQAWQLLSSPLSFVLSAEPRWSTSHYVSGDYETWTFTSCGFCVGPR